MSAAADVLAHRPLRLDVGCGARLREGHVGVDVRALPGVKYVCDAWELDRQLEPASVDAIYSRHFFEHLSFAQGELTLRAFRRVLRPQGGLQLIVPDIRYHMKQFLGATPRSVSAANPRWTGRQHALAGFWGWQRDGDRALWDVHKAGYDEDMLAEALKRAGFERVKRQPDRPWNLSLTAQSP